MIKSICIPIIYWKNKRIDFDLFWGDGKLRLSVWKMIKINEEWWITWGKHFLKK